MKYTDPLDARKAAIEDRMIETAEMKVQEAAKSPHPPFTIYLPRGQTFKYAFACARELHWNKRLTFRFDVAGSALGWCVEVFEV